MTPDQAHSVAESVRWLASQPGADVQFMISDAPLAPGQTVAISVRAYVPDELRAELTNRVGLVAYPARHVIGSGE